MVHDGHVVVTTKVDGNFDRTGLPDPVIISHHITANEENCDFDMSAGHCPGHPIATPISRCVPMLARAIMKRDAIHLDTLEQLASETTRIERLSADGRVHPLGNWSAAQVFQHLGLFVKGSLDGFSFRYPWHIRAVSRLVGRISWRLLMRLAFRPGFKNSWRSKSRGTRPGSFLARRRRLLAARNWPCSCRRENEPGKPDWRETI